MATTYTGLRVQDTYNAIIKIGDNSNLSGTAKLLSDGLGNDSPLYLSGTRLGIGISPAYQFHTSGNAKIGGNLIISGNLTVNGTLTYLNVTDLEVEDPLIKLAKDNTSNTLDIGFFGKYVESATTKYTGLFWDASTDKFRLYEGLQVEPTTTVDVTGTGYTRSLLNANLEGNVTGTVSSLSNHDTNDLVEGSVNLYYTNARADARVNLQTGANLDLSSKDTDDLSEGTTNLYFTTTRARASFTAGDGITITNGVIASEGDAEVAKRIEVTVKNVSGGSLAKGVVVHAAPTATPPSGNVIEVVAADANVVASMPAIGVLNETIADEAEGEAVMFGAVSGIDTSSFSIGDELYVSETAGAFTATKPTAFTSQVQKIAVVIKSHASNGLIKVFGAGRANDVPNRVDRDMNFTDDSQLSVGTDQDLKIYHNGTISLIQNLTGNLEIRQTADDKDIIFYGDDMSGGITPYFRIDGSVGFTKIHRNMRFLDNVQLSLGSSADLEIYHDGTDGYIDNINGELIIQNNSNDKKIIFKSDNGIGDITEYFRIDGNINRNVITVTTQLNDNVPLIFGSGAGSPSIKYDSTATQLFISGESKFLNDLYVVGNINTSENLKTTKSVYQTATGGGYINKPYGGDFYTTQNAYTGAIEIALPTGGTGHDDMIKFVVDIFDYRTQESVTVFVGGYTYQNVGSGNTTWYYVSATVLGQSANQNYTVRFGDNGTEHCVWIGDTTSTWNHLQVIVRDFFAGYTADINNYLGAWEINVVTTQTTVNNTLTNCFPMSSGDIGGPYLPLIGGTLTGALTGTSAHFTGNVEVGDGTNISMDASSNGQLMIDGNGYQGAIALDENAMHIYHNSSGRSLVLGTDETARLTIGGDGNTTLQKALQFTNAAAYTNPASIRQQSNNLIFSGGSDGYYFNKSDNSVTHFRIDSSGVSTFSGNVNVNGLTTMTTTNDFQLQLTSTDAWCGIGFNDGGTANEFLYYNGTYGTFAFGGGGSAVANKRLHVDGGMTIGTTYDATAVAASSLNVQGSITTATNLTIEGTVITQGGGVGQISLAGSGDNLMRFGPYNDNGYGYIESINNASGLYFNTNQGNFLFDTGYLGSYTDTEIDLGYSGHRFRDLNISRNAVIGGSIVSDTLSAAAIGISGSNGTDGKGISLYGGANSGQPTYGMMFMGTGTYGTMGYVTGSWATYFTMDNSSNRGWIFRDVVNGNKASINNQGQATFGTPSKFYTNDSELFIEDAGTNAVRIGTGAGDELYIGGNNTWQFRGTTTGQAQINSVGYFSVTAGAANYSGIQLYETDGNLLGYIYGDSGSTANPGIGILDSDGNWALRIRRDIDNEFRVNDVIKLSTGISNSYFTTDLGIGTTTLTNSSGYNTLSISGSSGGQIAFQTSGTGKQYIYSSATDLLFYNSQAGNFIFYTDGSNERMRINQYGQLLINATSSAYGPSLYGYNLGVRGTTAQSFISIARANQTLDSQGMVIGLDTANGYIGLRDNLPLNFTTNNSNRITILGNGNVGISSTTAQTPLDVYLGTGNNKYASIGGSFGSGYYQGIHFGYFEKNNLAYRKSAIVFERTDLTSGNAQGKVHILNGPQTGAGSATLADAKLTIIENGNVIIPESVTARSFGVSGTNGTDGYGISLYGGASADPTYGLMFQGTGPYGTYGLVNGNWATYFNMNSSSGRGWIFRTLGVGNVASVSNAGHLSLKGQIMFPTTNMRIKGDSSSYLRIQSGSASDSGIELQNTSGTVLGYFYGNTSQMGMLSKDGYNVFRSVPGASGDTHIYAGNGSKDWRFQGSNGYLYVPSWINLGGGAGLFSSTNSAHFYPYTGTYGTWRIDGSRGSYTGINMSYGDVNIGMYDSGGNGGEYNSSTGWHYYYHRANICLAVGGTTTSSAYSLYVTGKIIASNDIVAYSDKRSKENIVTVDNAIQKVNKLRGVYYTQKKGKDKSRKVGVIAQEINEVLPEVVTYAEDVDKYGVDYGKISGLLIEAIKELKAEVDELKNKSCNCKCK